MSGSFSKLKGFMDEKKAEKHYMPIEGHLLENVKSSLQEEYIKMLCVIVNEFENISENQDNWLNRIIKTVDSEKDVNYFVGLAKSIEIEDFKKFLDEIKNSDLKYNFILDMNIIEASGKDCSNREDIVEFCNDICDMLKFTKDDKKCLDLLAESVIYSDSSLFEDINSKNSNIDMSAFIGYIKEYAYGIISNNKNLFYFRYVNKEAIENWEEKIYNAKKIIFENVILKKDVIESVFSNKKAGKSLIKFVNCDMGGSIWSGELTFGEKDEIIMDNCKLDTLRLRFYDVKNLNIKNTKFSSQETFYNYLDINDCMSVTMENVKLSNAETIAFIRRCVNVVIDGCEFNDVKENAIILNSCPNCNIASSKFYNCRHQRGIWKSPYCKDGSVIFAGEVLDLKRMSTFGEESPSEVYIDNCIFEKCGGDNIMAFSIICNVAKSVKNSKFINCYSRRPTEESKLFPNKVDINENNEIINSVLFNDK